MAMMKFGFDDFVTADKQQHDFATRAGFRSLFLPPQPQKRRDTGGFARLAAGLSALR